MEIHDIATWLEMNGYTKIIDHDTGDSQPPSAYGYGALGDGANIRLESPDDNNTVYLIGKSTGEKTHTARKQ